MFTLSFLISLRGEWANARLIAQTTNYSVYSIRSVADEMVSAHLIESTQAKPVQYLVKLGAWRELGDLSPYMLSTKLRDLVEDYRYAFVLNQLDFPDPKRYPGEDFVPVFAKSIMSLAAWIKKEV